MPTEILVMQHGSARVALDLSHVREILRMLLPTPLPGAPAGVLGAVNLRGETIPLVDLETRLPAGAAPPGLEHHIVVLGGAVQTMAIAVTRAEDIHEVAEGEWRDTRDLIPGGPIAGVVRLGTELIPVLDPQMLLAGDEIVSLEALLKQLAGETA